MSLLLNHVHPGLFGAWVIGLGAVACAGALPSAEQTASTRPAVRSASVDVLSSQRWQEVDRAVDRGLTWLASQQSGDGFFPTLRGGQPGVTSLAALAFLSSGHTLESGPYKDVLRRAVDYVLECRKPDGLLCLDRPGSGHELDKPSRTGMYNHAISGLTLCEMYGASGGYKERELREAIEAAVQFTLAWQKKPKDDAVERGGWRYLSAPSQSDLSITSWQLMFLRAARNAEMAVPAQAIDAALVYVERSFTVNDTFDYTIGREAKQPETTAMIGAGVLSLSLAGKHQTEMATRAGRQILERNLPGAFGKGRFYYSAFYCTQAMLQLGGDHWRTFYPPLVAVLLKQQLPDGSWPAESLNDSRWGKAYSSAMALLCLTAPNQLLPIFQR